MGRIRLQRTTRIMHVPPSQGESAFKKITYKWLVVCPFCFGDGFTWAEEWSHAWENVKRHWNKHRWEWLSTRGNELVVMMPDENESQQFRG